MVIMWRLRSTTVFWLLMVAVMALGSAGGCAASIGGTAQGSAGHGSATSPPPAAASPAAGRGWTADLVLTGGRADIASPTGDVTAVVDDRGVCLHAGRPEDPERAAGPDAGTGFGVGQCVLTFTAGVTPAFAVFSPTGAHLMVVAGPAVRSEVYVIDARSWAVQAIGPQGIGPATGLAPNWDLSSAAWDVDGSAVLLVPRTGQATGAMMLGVELTGGAPYQRAVLPAGLANSAPSLWSTAAGIAVVANTGDQRNVLWWADFGTGSVERIATFDPQESVVLGAADPLGRTVLVCQRGPDGALGPTIGIAVADRRTAPLLPGSLSCAGAVFSPDGKYLAVTDQLAAGYALRVVEAAGGVTVLSVPLPVPAPSAPPYLTWTGNVIVASDVTGQWPLSAAVVRIRR